MKSRSVNLINLISNECDVLFVIQNKKDLPKVCLGSVYLLYTIFFAEKTDFNYVLILNSCKPMTACSLDNLRLVSSIFGPRQLQYKFSYVYRETSFSLPIYKLAYSLCFYYYLYEVGTKSFYYERNPSRSSSTYLRSGNRGSLFQPYLRSTSEARRSIEGSRGSTFYGSEEPNKSKICKTSFVPTYYEPRSIMSPALLPLVMKLLEQRRATTKAYYASTTFGRRASLVEARRPKVKLVKAYYATRLEQRASTTTTFGREALCSNLATLEALCSNREALCSNRPTFGQVVEARRRASLYLPSMLLPTVAQLDQRKRSQAPSYSTVGTCGTYNTAARIVDKALFQCVGTKAKLFVPKPLVKALGTTTVDKKFSFAQENSKNFLIAFSGGQDSITLLVLLFGIQSQNLLKLNLLWNHHLWHKDSFFITRHILKLSFLFKIKTHSAIAITPVKTELQARQWRLRTSCRLKNFYKYETVMQAHSGTDKIETLLLNLFRGTGNISPFCLTDFRSYVSQTQKRKLVLS